MKIIMQSMWVVSFLALITWQPARSAADLPFEEVISIGDRVESVAKFGSKCELQATIDHDEPGMSEEQLLEHCNDKCVTLADGTFLVNKKIGIIEHPEFNQICCCERKSIFRAYQKVRPTVNKLLSLIGVKFEV